MDERLWRMFGVAARSWPSATLGGVPGAFVPEATAASALETRKRVGKALGAWRLSCSLLSLQLCSRLSSAEAVGQVTDALHKPLFIFACTFGQAASRT